MGGIILFLESELKLYIFLDLCVDEFNGLWRGVLMFISFFFVLFRVIVVLFCVVVDIFVICKVCGFVGYFVNRVCLKCFKFFIGGFGEKKDFLGF